MIMSNRAYILVSELHEIRGIPQRCAEIIMKHFKIICMEEFQRNKEEFGNKIQVIFVWEYCPRVDEELLKSLPFLKAIVNFGVGVDHLDLPLISSFGVKVANTPDAVDAATADMGMALMLASARNILEDTASNAGQWRFDSTLLQDSDFIKFMEEQIDFFFSTNSTDGHRIATSPDTKVYPANWNGAEVTGSTLGIIGMGRIGYRVAQRARGFDMKILYHNRNRRADEEERLVGARYCAKIDDLLQESDFVMVVVNLTPQTHKLIGERELCLMKSTATLINISRGAVIDQAALVQALQKGSIRAAALDVTDPEPLPRKKFWYESPTLGSQLLYKPSSLENVLKPQHKMQKEGTLRMRALNKILYKAITDLLNSTEVSPEIFEEKIEISKVRLTVDFSACRVYWVPSGLLEKDNHIQQVLEKHSPRVRHLLITQQVMGCPPPVVFVRDREQAAIAEVESLLNIADYGSINTADATQVLDTKHFGQLAADPALKPTHQGSSPVSSHLPPSAPELDLFGINHDLLNKQILEYKKKNTQKLLETDNSTLSEQHLEQIAQLKKLKVKKKKFNASFDDITPEMYLLEKYSVDSLDTFSDREEEQKELDEEIKELEFEEEDPENPSKIPEDIK
ncbi:uncharacterized protein LOC132378534 isoform X2 [Hypanus sabinus]|uniref:uncharacterized protein LOC132378534 isoform X2 n=1 Tax=Hypanus sabinus TaxID=79690 RepID=UPI0028C3CEAF|nr:uncharacterized protein LOC132378534 isoform X2 [Hypanus sabinus]